MSAPARADQPSDIGDRIDVTDDRGQRLGWVDPLSGERTLLVAECRDVFDEVVDFWLTAAGLDPGHSPKCDEPPDLPVPQSMHVTEVRFPDPPTVRTLVVPLVRAD